jgi:hypothetical protein
VAVAVAVAGAVVVARRDPPPAPERDAAPAVGEDRGEAADEEPVAVASDAPRYTRLADLVAAADLVVAGEVASTERGRTFGEPGGAAIVSRLVTLRVDEVLAGTAPAGAANVLVEEEGWLEDGRPLAVDGAAPTEEGDRGVWFLVDVDDPELPVYTVVNAAGRYLVEGEATLVGPDGDDPLVAEVEAMTPDALADEVARLAP